MAAATPVPLAQADSGEEKVGWGWEAGSVLTRRVTPKPTPVRDRRGGRSHWVGPGAIHSSNSLYIVCVCVCLRRPRSRFWGRLNRVSPSRRPVT